jgi:hypothetical protein
MAAPSRPARPTRPMRLSSVEREDVLLAVERAAPGDAAEAVTRSIGVSLGASWVSFLVADMSGRALVRLAHVPIADRPDC